jgi:hypothetical protein
LLRESYFRLTCGSCADEDKRNQRFRPKGSLAVPREVDEVVFGFEEASLADVLDPDRPRGLDEVGARVPVAPLASLIELP